MNVPNILTVSRIVLSIPLFVCCAFSQWELVVKPALYFLLFSDKIRCLELTKRFQSE